MPTIIPAQSGWFVVTACVDQDHVPVRLLEEPVIAWAVTAETDGIPGTVERCKSTVWPITAGLFEMRFDRDHWGLKKPNGEYSFAGTRFANADDCLAEFVKLAADDARGQKVGKLQTERLMAGQPQLTAAEQTELGLL